MSDLKWQRKWRGISDGASWTLECDIDRFASEEPVVVTVEVANSDGECGLACLSPEQARELSASLLHEADNADANNARSFRAGAVKAEASNPEGGPHE